MTNASIILNESFRLMNEGVLTGTGRFVEVENDDGTTERLELPEEIHTFNAWKQRGYCVKKGEHAVASFSIWKYIKGKEADDLPDTEEAEKTGGYCRLKLSHFFTAAQVQPLTTRA